MGQDEGTEKEISFDCLRTMVDEAIETKNICIIDKIEKENQLKYMQKYAELRVSKDEILIGIHSYILALMAIGVAYFLINPLDFTKSIAPYAGVSIIGAGLIVLFFWNRKYMPEIEFTHKIILKIQEKRPNRPAV